MQEKAESSVSESADEEVDEEQVQAIDRRYLLRAGILGVGGVAGAIGVASLLSQNVAAVNFNENVNPSLDNTYDLGTSTLRWRDLYLAGRARFGSKVFLRENPVGELELIHVDTNDKAPFHAWSFLAKQGFAAVRVENSDGFREMHLRDGNFSINGGFGRFAWLIADRIEPQQYSWYEHFTAGQLPTGWTEQGTGTSQGIDGPGGIRRLSTKTQSATNRRLFTGTGTTMIRPVRPNAEMHTQVAYKTPSAASVVYCLGIVNVDVPILTNSNSTNGILDITEGVYVWYDSSLHTDGKWRAVMRSAGLTRHLVALDGNGGRLNVPVDTTAAHQWRFEYWPTGQAGFIVDTIKVYHDGQYINVPFNSVPPGGQNLAPFFGVQNRASGVKSLDIGYYFLWQAEVYNW